MHSLYTSTLAPQAWRPACHLFIALLLPLSACAGGGCQGYGSLFTTKAVYGDYLLDGLALEGCVERPLLLPFLTHFDACMRNVTTEAPGQYGPLPPGGRVLGGTSTVGVASGPGDVDELESYIQTSHIEAPILVHAFTAGEGSQRAEMVGMMRSWLAHITRVGLSSHVLFIGGSATDCSAIIHLAPCAVHKWRRRGGGDGRHSDSVDFRWNVTLALLRLGRSVIQADSDAFVLSARAVQVLEQSPLLVQGLADRLPADLLSYKGQKMQGYCANDGTCQSTGFTYLRAQEVVSNEVAAFVERLDSERGWEQALWQRHAAKLREMGVYGLLNQTGPDAFANWLAAEHAMKRRKDSSFLVLHAGYEHGREKERIFRCAQLWLGD